MELDEIVIGSEQSPLLEETMVSETIEVTDPLSDRYNTFGFISWWKQEVVREATVMVVGAGALGNEVIKNLVLMGVGRLFIVDFDTIDDSNLSRSILYRASDNGRKKAEVAAEAARELNPDVAVQWFHGDINHDIGLGVFRQMDVVIGCLDNREARLAINKACWHLDKPWVDGAIQELLGIARVFRPNDGACYECTLTDEDYRIINIRMSCQLLAHQNIIQGKVPTTPTISSIVASIQTQEALKLLHGMDVESGKALVFNGLNNDVYPMAYGVREDCPSHWVYEDIVELKEATVAQTTVGELLEIARQQLDDSVLLEIPSFVTDATCGSCHVQHTLMRPRHTLTFTDAQCSECGTLMDLNEYEQVKGDEPFLQLSLHDIGIPPLAIVPARTKNWQYLYFEMTGDTPSFFNFILSNLETLNTFYERRQSWQMITKSK